jgi:hypothetical protein
LNFGALAPNVSRMIRASIANALIASVVIAEILGGMMLLLQLQH